MKTSSRNYLILKFLIFISIVFLFIIFQTISLYFAKPQNLIIIDALFAFLASFIIIEAVFYLVGKKEKQLNEQINQLCEAYQYIGQINRKIDALLELDISALDHSKKMPLHESSSDIFKRLINLLQAKAGYLYLKPPIQFKIFHGDQKNQEIKKTFEQLLNSGLKDFKYSQGSDNERYFKKLGVKENLLKKYTILVKPVYMHDQDMGMMFLLFKKNQTLEDRDFNIIRIYSFYLALNYTFKPDLSIYQS